MKKTLKALIAEYNEVRADAEEALAAAEAAYEAEDEEAFEAAEKRHALALGKARELADRIDKARETQALPRFEVVAGAGGEEQPARRERATPPALTGLSRHDPSDLAPPTAAQIARQVALMRRRDAGERLSDEQTETAGRRWGAVELFSKVLTRGHPEHEPLEGDERKAWNQLQAEERLIDREGRKAAAKALKNRAYANPITGATGAGSSFLPTILRQELWGIIDRTELMPLAGGAYSTSISLPWEANLDVALLSGTGSFAPQAPGVDKDPIRPTDSKVTWTPRKYSVHAALAEEMLIGGGYTNFRERLMQWLAVQVIANSLNIDATKGAGGSTKTSVIKGALTGLSGNYQTVTASGTAITAAEVRGAILDVTTRFGAAGLVAMMTPKTESYLAQLTISGGTMREFPSQNGRISLDLGVPVVWNNAMSEIPTTAGAGNHVILVGNFTEYVKLMIGGMRFSTDYDQQSDSQLISFFQSLDGQRVRDDGFHLLTLKAS